jgi:2-succinyl-6-hydroxy-2,4-cyclohexadiene-1-carboxylate synthase
MTPPARTVLVHGFTQTARSWSEVASYLGEALEVEALDAPSHGALAGTPASDLAEAARMIGDAGGTATYVGYSMGGRICLQLAVDRPDLVRRLVLASTSAGIEDPLERAARRTADEALADRLDPPAPGAPALDLGAFLDEWLAAPLFAHLTPAGAGRAARLGNTTQGLAASLRTTGTGAMLPLWDRLAELAMPVLLVAGELDAKYADLARRMAGRIAGSSVEVVPGAGHAVPFERPREFAELVRRFVQEA